MPWVFISCRLSIIKEDGFLFILSRKRTAFVIYYASTRSIAKIIPDMIFYFISSSLLIKINNSVTANTGYLPMINYTSAVQLFLLDFEPRQIRITGTRHPCSVYLYCTFSLSSHLFNSAAERIPISFATSVAV